MKRVLVVDDDEPIRTQLRWGLSDEYEVLTAGTPDEAVDAVRRGHPHLVTLDLALTGEPGESEEGFDLLDVIREESPGTKVVMLTATSDRTAQVRSIERGAYDYFVKPINLEELKILIRRALRVGELEAQVDSLPDDLCDVERFQDMMGSCPAMTEIFAIVRRVARTSVPVFVTGESGTGKELLARAIHHLSESDGAPFVPVSCGAATDRLLDAALLDRDGSPTAGARSSQGGETGHAAAGTVFLDEVTELPASLQAGLVRFFSDQRANMSLDARDARGAPRVIAASERDIDKEVSEGRFRRDLCYHLGVVRVALPPLRDRGDDVALLARALVHRYNREHGRRVGGFTRKAMRAIMTHSWPGNLRELENRIRRAVIVSRGRFVSPADLDLDDGTLGGTTLDEARSTMERGMLERALRRNLGNVSRAARELGVSRPTFYTLIKKHRVQPSDYKRSRWPRSATGSDADAAGLTDQEANQ